MPTDPKWRVIAIKSKQPIPNVISVYLHLMVSASTNADERGRTQTNAEEIAASLGLDESAVNDILQEMEARVLNGEKLSGWAKRQPKREDGSAERTAEWRKVQRARTHMNAGEQNRTQKNAEKRREEKSREEEENPPIVPPGDVPATAGGDKSKAAIEIEKALTKEQLPWFKSWYGNYWRKKEPIDAAKAFGRHIRSPEHFAQLLQAFGSQQPEMLSREPEKRPYPASWLNSGAWLESGESPPAQYRISNGRGKEHWKEKYNREFAELITEEMGGQNA